jgi:hypothetical protein
MFKTNWNFSETLKIQFQSFEILSLEKLIVQSSPNSNQNSPGQLKEQTSNSSETKSSINILRMPKTIAQECHLIQEIRMKHSWDEEKTAW